MKNSFIFIALIFLIMSCNKDNETKFVTELSDEVIKYKITLIDNQISAYHKYINDELIEKTIYQDFDSIVLLLRTNASDEVIYKRIYQMGENDLAVSAIDTGYSDNRTYTANLNFSYQDGFLVNTLIDYKQTGENENAGMVIISKTIENDNIVSSRQALSVSSWVCTHRYTFNDLDNKLDIVYFNNGVTGKISKNLVHRASWNTGCPCGPSTSIATSGFSYELDQNGYVTKITETYTPCYHLTSSTLVTQTIHTTLYEYDKR